ncbi:MAG: hypothetical protein QM535_21740 [Limnohabitans sp.]|nr:hypothetical protein [Limnohabitans sp.]
MEIIAKITGIEYKINLSKELEKIDFAEFDINKSPTSCLISDKKKLFAISKWVSPKRTRSYPYERIYNTLSIAKKITIIPIVKDEGSEGDRDFIQWDTISLMSLLDVYIILGYYNSAEKHKTRKNKITNQKFDNEFIINKIREIENYHSSALHWNLKEIKDNLPTIIDKVKKSYIAIETKLKTKLHGLQGLDTFKTKIESEVNAFMDFSRKKAKDAQSREIVTNQPKESLQTLTKTKITITNYLGGKYFLTVDEVKINKNTISLIESKHSKSTLLPGISDIKDGLIKMILFTNLKEISINSIELNCKPILQLTSSKLKSSITSSDSKSEIENFVKTNKLTVKHQQLLDDLLIESKNNNFTIIINKG